MKRMLQIGFINCIRWILIGLFLVSCNATPSQTTTPLVTLPLITVATNTIQSSIRSTTPLMAFNLSNGDNIQSSLNTVLWLPGGKLVLSGAKGISLYHGLQASLQAQAVPVFQTQAAAENPTLLAATSDGSELSWLSGERKIMFWDMTRSEAASNIGESDSPVTGLTLNPNKTELAYSNIQGNVIFQHTGSHEITQKWKLGDWLNNLTFSPDGQYLAGATLSNFTVTIYTQNGEVVKQLAWADAVNPAFTGAYFSPNWQKIAWVARGAVQLMDVASGKQTFLLNHEDAVGAIAWAPDNLLLATSSILSQSGVVTAAVFIWNTDTGLLSATYPMTEPVQSINFAPDAKSLAVLDVTGQLRIWSLVAK